MTIFSIIQSQIMQKKKPVKPNNGEKDTPPENPDNKKENGPEK